MTKESYRCQKRRSRAYLYHTTRALQKRSNSRPKKRDLIHDQKTYKTDLQNRPTKQTYTTDLRKRPTTKKAYSHVSETKQRNQQKRPTK